MLLRRYCTLRDLPPDFRVAEQTEADAIRLEIFQNTLEDFYKDRANQADFSAMADQLGFGRDDRRLIDLCLSCYDEVRCRRDMGGWMKQAEAAYARISPLEESPWGAFWMKELQDTLRFASESLQKAIDAFAPGRDAGRKIRAGFRKESCAGASACGGDDMGWRVRA